jgi:hypothetical protein
MNPRGYTYGKVIEIVETDQSWLDLASAKYMPAAENCITHIAVEVQAFHSFAAGARPSYLTAVVPSGHLLFCRIRL